MLSKVFLYMIDGWPGKDIEEAMLPNWRRREEISIEVGCLFWGKKLLYQ